MNTPTKQSKKFTNEIQKSTKEVYHGQLGFYFRFAKQIGHSKSINIIQHINKLRRKKHVIKSAGRKKVTKLIPISTLSK